MLWNTASSSTIHNITAYVIATKQIMSFLESLFLDTMTNSIAKVYDQTLEKGIACHELTVFIP